MKIFIDTANLEEIKKAQDLGILDGVTTNPTLLSREKAEPRKQIEMICAAVEGPVSAEVTHYDKEGMLKEAEELAQIAPNIVVKIPLTEAGLQAVKVLAEKKIRTNVTLCFSPLQALLAAKAGAGFISPFVGRLDDISHKGIELVREIKAIYENYKITTEIIVASVRSPLHVWEAAKIGADIATLPYKVIAQLCRHPLTDIGIERFINDWDNLKNFLESKNSG